jgi:hypothetical protein
VSEASATDGRPFRVGDRVVVAPGTASIGDDLIYAKGFAEIAPVRDGALAWPLNGSAINDAQLDAVAERLAPATLLASRSA